MSFSSKRVSEQTTSLQTVMQVRLDLRFLMGTYMRNCVLCLPLCWLVNNYIYSYSLVHTRLWFPNNKKTHPFPRVHSAVSQVKEGSDAHGSGFGVKPSVDVPLFHEKRVAWWQQPSYSSSVQHGLGEQLTRTNETLDFVIHFLQICLDDIVCLSLSSMLLA